MVKKLSMITSVLLITSKMAFAQNSVTLYGAIDEGLVYTNNASGHAAWQMADGYVLGSRWGLKGSEDLGGGTSAIFTIESGFDVNNGALNQGGRMFGRQAYVGLSSPSYGTLTFGRQYDSVVDYLALTTANGNWGGYLFAHPVDNDNTDNSFRVNNAVKYASAKLGGLTFGGLYGFSNDAGGFGNNRTLSAGAQYSFSSVTIAAAYLENDHPGATSTGSLASNDANFTAEKQRVYGVGVLYTLSPVTFGLSYTHTALDRPTGTEYLGSFTTTPNSLNFNNYEVNVKYQITPAFFVGAMYTYSTANFNAAGSSDTIHWNQAGLAADYSLSKATGVYAQAVYQKVSGANTGTALDTAYIPGSAAPSSTSSQVAVRVGLRHFF